MGTRRKEVERERAAKVRLKALEETKASKKAEKPKPAPKKVEKPKVEKPKAVKPKAVKPKPALKELLDKVISKKEVKE